MPFDIKSILRNSSTRILVIIFFSLVALTIFFLAQGFFNQIHLFQTAELNRLSGIANTIATEIDGDAHERIYNQYTQQGELKTHDQDPDYLALHELLTRAKLSNKLETQIYTLVYEPGEHAFAFVGTTSDEPYYRDLWHEFEMEHVDHYPDGGRIKPYEDENGNWLSAFAPIKNRLGKVVGIVQVDESFDRFIDNARNRILINILISVGVFLIIAVFMLRSIRTILMKEEELTKEIVAQKVEIEAKNKDILDSIFYAKKIQEAILPSVSRIREAFPDSFVLYLPKDIVSGDFYWYSEVNRKCIIAAVDCTGHGVPGALMSMIGNTLLNDIVNHQQITTPSVVLDKLHDGINKALRQDQADVQSRDGMDLALCAICRETKTIEYSGAYRPLFLVRKGEIIETKGNKFPIGGGMEENQKFTNHTIALQGGDACYIFSDGFPDQFGGHKGKKYMTKRFRDLLLTHMDQSLIEQRTVFHREFEEWRGSNEQVDDVLVIGLRIPD